MNILDIVLGTKLYIAPEASGTADRTNKPAYDSASWLEFGGVTSASIDVTGTGEDPVFKPVDGVLQLYNVHDTKRTLTIDVELTDVSSKYLSQVFGASITVNTAFIPLSGRVNRRMWMKMEQMDDSNNSVILLELFTSAKVTEAMQAGEGVIRPKMRFTVIYSTLNVGNVPTASGL